MTDLPPRSPLPEPLGDEADLLASLYLDGEATAEERARVEADPALLALVEEFRVVADNIGAVSVPSGLAVSQIGAALDAFDAQMSTAPSIDAAPAPEAASNVASLADRRTKRSAGLPSWLGAAAVMALVVGGLGFAATQRSGDDDEAATADVAPAASASNEANESAATTMAAEAESDAAAGAEQLTESDAGDTAGDADMADEAMDDEAMEEEGSEGEAAAPNDRSTLTPEEAAAYYADNGPINLADVDPGTASEYYEQLINEPLQSIDASPCADSPVVAGLFGVDSFIPVVFDGQMASLIVQAGAPNTALIVGPTCEIEQS